MCKETSRVPREKGGCTRQSRDRKERAQACLAWGLRGVSGRTPKLRLEGWACRCRRSALQTASKPWKQCGQRSGGGLCQSDGVRSPGPHRFYLDICNHLLPGFLVTDLPTLLRLFSPKRPVIRSHHLTYSQAFQLAPLCLLDRIQIPYLGTQGLDHLHPSYLSSPTSQNLPTTVMLLPSRTLSFSPFGYLRRHVSSFPSMAHEGRS